MPTTRPERQESHGQACFQVAYSEEKTEFIVWAGQIKGDPSFLKAAKGIW